MPRNRGSSRIAEATTFSYTEDGIGSSAPVKTVPDADGSALTTSSLSPTARMRYSAVTVVDRT